MLPPDKRTRLVRLCGMLGSDHVGERAAAGLKANQLVRELGLTWDQVITSGGAESKTENKQEQWEKKWSSWENQKKPWGDQTKAGHVQMAEFCINSNVFWTKWEKEFLQNVVTFHYPTDRQIEILTKLYEKAKRHTAW